MSNPTLDATDVWLSHGGPAVVQGVNLSLTPGAAPVGIIGPSGVGKSTLVAALLGQLRPTRGHITYGGRTVAKLPRGDKKQFRSRVRAVGQNGLGLDLQWSVERALRSAYDDARKAGRTNSRPMGEALLDVALGPAYLGRRLQTLSGGEKQRLALAIALAARPELLILDEPLTAVDPDMRGRIVRMLTKLVDRDRLGVLLVSHDLETVDRLCPTVHAMAGGQFVATGSLAEVLRAEHPVIVELAQAAPLAVQRFR